jgi:site-specific DNA-cytosine methylase
MNTGRQALENVGIKVNKYYSSEIKPYAIELTQHHFPDTIQVGDVTKWREWDIDWKTINLVLSGSPCQDLSAAGKRAGINGSKSSLFFVFVEILEHIKSLNPKVLFLQENVGSASKLDIGIMSRALGVYPCRINSKLVTAQLRDRYYWSNIKTKETMFDIVTDIPQPKDRGIMFKDIITGGRVERVKANAMLESDYKHIIKDKTKQDIYIKKRIEKGKQTPNLIYENKTYQINPSKESGGKQPFMQNRIYDVNGKSPALTECMAHKIKYKTFPLIYEEDNELRCKTNTLNGYEVITENDCINLAFPTSTTRRGRITKGKSPCLTKVIEPLYSYKDGIVRTVNKIEMCRLQGFPDNYCDILTTAKAGSLLEDGWTLPIIEHIFRFIEL